MMFSNVRERIRIEGIMPERALLRLKRAGIDVFHVKKPQKNQIVFSVKKKDTQKVFAIYPKVCYNITEYTPYTATYLGAQGVGRYLEKAKNRVGFLLGILLFCGCSLFADSFVLDVQFVSSDVYAREALAVLEENGVKPFSVYQGGKEDLICAKLLSLKGVEFCSVKKTGLWLRVEMRLDTQSSPKYTDGDLVAKHEGKIVALTALKGTALKAEGDFVKAGETLVGGWFEANGEKTKVQAIARVYIACTYEACVEAEDEQSAFAKAYLALELSQNDTIVCLDVAADGCVYKVHIEYTVIETINF